MFKRIVHIWFPGSWWEYSIVSNHFWCSKILTIQFQVSLTDSKNRENPRIQPIKGYDCRHIWSQMKLLFQAYLVLTMTKIASIFGTPPPGILYQIVYTILCQDRIIDAKWSYTFSFRIDDPGSFTSSQDRILIVWLWNFVHPFHYQLSDFWRSTH